MRSRLEFHKELCRVLESDHCYFQPPSSVQMKYPCIVYSMRPYFKTPADNDAYLLQSSYDIIVIDKNPDSKIPLKLMKTFRACKFDRVYQSDNLNHFALTINF